MTADDLLEPDDHSGDRDADPAAVDPDHFPDPDYREARYDRHRRLWVTRWDTN